MCTNWDESRKNPRQTIRAYGAEPAAPEGLSEERRRQTARGPAGWGGGDRAVLGLPLYTSPTQPTSRPSRT